MQSADVVVVGTGFASTFFLSRWLEDQPDDLRVLVLEAGPVVPHADVMRHASRPVRFPFERYSLHGDSPRTFHTSTTGKAWSFTTAFGGGSNCWAACTPRLHPSDFELASRYGVGVDWPLTYDDLEPYYVDAERIMQVSGPSDAGFPRSAPYPQPPHRLTPFDRALKARHPGKVWAQPCARPRLAVQGRPACCGNRVCTLCPIDSKFSVLNSMMHVYDDPRITLQTQARVLALDVQGGEVRGVHIQRPDGPQTILADLVVLGANAMFNPHILLASGLDHPQTGVGLTEQTSVVAKVLLDGITADRGSTLITGHAYTAYDGPHRRERAGCLMELWNAQGMRDEPGRRREIAAVVLVYEDLRRSDNTVTVDPADPARPRVHFAGHSDWAERGKANAQADLDALLDGLPVEDAEIVYTRPSEAHLQCSTPMSDDPAQGVTDGHGVHHDARNVVVLGSGLFPTAPAANPTLTLSALALRTADHLGRMR